MREFAFPLFSQVVLLLDQTLGEALLKLTLPHQMLKGLLSQ